MLKRTIKSNSIRTFSLKLYNIGARMDNDLNLLAYMVDNINHLRNTIPQSVLLSMVLKNYSTMRSLSYVDIGILIEERTDAVDVYCIIDILDGLMLRTHGINKPLVLLYWHPAEKAGLMHQWSLEPAALNLEWVQTAGKVLKGVSRPLKVHLWIDVGMGREGVHPKDVLPLARAIAACPVLKLQGIGTHFPLNMKTTKAGTTWATYGDYTSYQRIFEDTLRTLTSANLLPTDVIIHAATSNAIHSKQEGLYYDMVRIGSLIYYGEEPQRHFTQAILQVKDIRGCVGYDKFLPEITHVALIEISGNRNKKMAFHWKNTEVKEIMPGILDVTGIGANVGDDIDITFKPKA